MTYKDFCDNIKTILASVDKYNAWRAQTLQTLLSNVAPRLGRLNQEFHCGCGFFYSHLQTLSSLIDKLCIPWQVNGNHFADYEEENLRIIGREISFELLMESIVMAEACVQARQTGQKCTCMEQIEKKRKESEERSRRRDEGDKCPS